MSKLSKIKLFVICWLAWLAVGCQSSNTLTTTPIDDGVPTFVSQPQVPPPEQSITSKYGDRRPQQWGEQTSGVAFRLNTEDKVIALTFDACGGSTRSNGFDADLINYLNQMRIPATLFISGQWIIANREVFLGLADNPCFEIGNHGFSHLPCSISGKSAYGIKGTTSIAAVVDEISKNQQLIQSLTGKQPRYYRSGTNFYDEVGVQIAKDLGTQPVGYAVLGDAGATYSRRQVADALLNAPAGSIIIFHFNHPEGATAEGIKDAIPKLLAQGFRFVQLSDYDLICYP